MEKEKRKRGEKEGKIMEAKKKKKKVVRKEEEEEASEEEVEEFFAILKRMKAVVNYFKKGGVGDQGWRATVEADKTVVATADDGGDAKDGIFDNREVVADSRILDLNEAPVDDEEDPLADLGIAAV